MERELIGIVKQDPGEIWNLMEQQGSNVLTLLTAILPHLFDWLSTVLSFSSSCITWLIYLSTLSAHSSMLMELSLLSVGLLRPSSPLLIPTPKKDEKTAGQRHNYKHNAMIQNQNMFIVIIPLALLRALIHFTKTQKCQPAGGTRGKVSGSPISIGFWSKFHSNPSNGCWLTLLSLELQC